MNSPAFKFASLKLSLNSALIPIVALLLAGVLTIGRAFNTGDLNSLHRFGLWLTVCALVAVQVLVFRYLVHRYVFRSLAYGQFVSNVSAVVLTIFAVAAELHVLKYTPILPKRVDPPLEFLAFVWLPIAVISAIFILLHKMLYLHAVDRPSMDVDLVTGETNAVDSDESMPEWRRSKTLRVQVEDHYLRIFNQNRQFFIRGKMSEAIQLLKPKEGMRVHRSHWVSFEHVDEIQKEGRDYHLRLNDGDRIPVSRGRASEVLKSLERFSAMSNE